MKMTFMIGALLFSSVLMASPYNNCNAEGQRAGQAALRDAQKSFGYPVCWGVVSSKVIPSTSTARGASLFLVTLHCRTTKPLLRQVLVVKENGSCRVKKVSRP